MTFTICGIEFAGLSVSVFDVGLVDSLAGRGAFISFSHLVDVAPMEVSETGSRNEFYGSALCESP